MSVRKAIALIGVFAVVLAISSALLLHRPLTELARTDSKISRLQMDFLSAKKNVVNLDILKRQYAEVDRLLAEVSRRLPGSWDAHGAGIERAARESGLHIRALDVERAERDKEFYFERFAELEIAGSFGKLAAFVDRLQTLPGFPRLTRFEILRGPRDGLLTLRGTLQMFRYRDEMQPAASRRGKGGKPRSESDWVRPVLTPGFIVACIVGSSACTRSEAELRRWHIQISEGLRGLVRPLPRLKRYPSPPSEADRHGDPFSPGGNAVGGASSVRDR